MDNIELHNGDCLAIMNQFPDKSVDLIVTDPPYWHKKSPGKPYSKRNQCNTKSKFSNSSLYSQDGYMMKGMSDFDDKKINIFLTECKRLMKKMNIYTFCSEIQVPYYCIWAEQNSLMSTIMVWEKPLSIINKNRFSQNLEYIVRIYDYGTALNRLSNNEWYNRVRKVPPINGSKKYHPTQKPVNLIIPFIELSSKKGDIILDPFMGSGSTGIAAICDDRKFIGIELDKGYYNIAEKRIKNAIIERKSRLF